ncbi:MAG TPA: fused gamma-glutamyl-gamma-aminobutyrate hydrolase/peptidase, partial [Prevotella sp.]|nr:fused gamma-glutamyl-gamma-aminobutyrate hydrolase/peptidase [Prevotella sp.]
MKDFNLESCLDGIYSSFPEANPLPMIGLTADYSDIDATIRSVYYKQVVAAGGIPVLIPPVADEDVLTGTLEHLDGLILTGGGDLNPLWYGEEPSPQLHHINKERDLAELLITRLAYNRQIPILGICRGIQTLTIALGGKITQDINQKIKHDQNADRREPTHSVTLHADSILYNIYHKDHIFVNSFH